MKCLGLHRSRSVWQKTGTVNATEHTIFLVEDGGGSILCLGGTEKLIRVDRKMVGPKYRAILEV